jgi:hypothetical protein
MTFPDSPHSAERHVEQERMKPPVDISNGKQTLCQCFVYLSSVTCVKVSIFLNISPNSQHLVKKHPICLALGKNLAKEFLDAISKSLKNNIVCLLVSFRH